MQHKQTHTHTHSSPFIPVFTEILNLLHYLFLGEKSVHQL